MHASRRHGAILGFGDGLRADVDARQHHAVPYTKHGQGDCEDRFGSALVEEDEQAAPDGRDDEAEPDAPAEVTQARGQHSNDDRAWYEETNSGEQVDAGTNGDAPRTDMRLRGT